MNLRLPKSTGQSGTPHHGQTPLGAGSNPRQLGVKSKALSRAALPELGEAFHQGFPRMPWTGGRCPGLPHLWLHSIILSLTPCETNISPGLLRPQRGWKVGSLVQAIQDVN